MTIEKRDFWKQRLAPYSRANDKSGAWQFVSTGGLFVATWWLMLESLVIGWWAPLLLAPFAAGLLVRLFIIQHDCGHGSFFNSRKLNDSVGFALGIVTLTPYRWWKRNHALHHGSSGDLDRRSVGDVLTLTVKEFESRPWRGRMAYRLYRHPLVLLGLGPVWLFVLKRRLPIGTPLSWRREWRDVLINNAALAAIVVVFAKTIGLVPLLLVHGPAFLLSATAGVWLFYVQHQFETPCGPTKRTGTSSMLASSVAPSTTCRESCTGLPATSAITTCTTSRATFPTTSWLGASRR